MWIYHGQHEAGDVEKRRDDKDDKDEKGSDDPAGCKLAADALIDMRSFTRGKSLFRKRKERAILTRRDELMLANPKISKIGAYQKALKELWASADQESWEKKGVSELEDKYEYVPHPIDCQTSSETVSLG